MRCMVNRLRGPKRQWHVRWLALLNVALFHVTCGGRSGLEDSYQEAGASSKNATVNGVETGGAPNTLTTSAAGGTSATPRGTGGVTSALGGTGGFASNALGGTGGVTFAALGGAGGVASKTLGGAGGIASTALGGASRGQGGASASGGSTDAICIAPSTQTGLDAGTACLPPTCEARFLLGRLPAVATGAGPLSVAVGDFD